MSLLALRPAAETRWDCLALGEVMLRFDPGEGRLRNARSLAVWEGGGEYNVARGLAKAFRLRSSVVTALPDNDLGRLVEDLIQQGGVDVSNILWRPYDGLGRNTRVGLNFTERGFGVRAAAVTYDRGYSAASQIAPGEIDWGRALAGGVRWFHTGGIFAALSPAAAQATLEAVRAARAAGAVVSYDLNYRAFLWNAHPDRAAAQALNRAIAAEADVLIGDAFAFEACLGVETDGLPAAASAMDAAPFRALAARAHALFPNLKIATATLRDPKTASRNDWSAVISAGGEVHQARLYRDLDILDRIGGGDAYVAGLAYALMAGKPPAEAVEYGAAHGALAMTTPGDNSMVDAAEVEALVAGANARVRR